LECVNEPRIPNSNFHVLGYQQAPADRSLPTAADLTSSGERASTRAAANREYRSVVSGFFTTGAFGEGGQPDKTRSTVRLKADTTAFQRDGPPEGGHHRISA
jgi:hypothetical protein